MIAFVLMTALVSGAFSLGVVVVVRFIEERLVSEEMHHELNNVLHEDLRLGRPPRLDSNTQFYASNSPDYAIPKRFEAFGDGFSEWVGDEQALYVYAMEINGARYLLVKDQSEFETHENALLNVVLAGFIFSILGAWGLGKLMSERVMSPVSRLARQVMHADQLQPTPPPLSTDYPDDEVGQLAKAFDSTFSQLRLFLEREQLFTSDVSHELRTPLMVIASSCELLNRTSLPERQQAQVQRIERAAQEMQSLVQTFLQLARGNTGNTDFSASASLSLVAEQQSRHWSELLEEKGIAFEYILESTDDGHYNATLLGAVMANLLRNALHHTDHGQVRLVLAADGFRVEDDGLGIPFEQLESIFRPFVRGPQARGEGLGLGLSLVKRICDHQGWTITVSSLPKAGTCFSVRFNRADNKITAPHS